VWLKNYSATVPTIYGERSRLKTGKNVSLVNTLFNLSSGNIYIGDNTIFGHGCMVITGVHQFKDGRRKKLVTGGDEAPLSGYDIKIGSGCWIASGSIIIGRVKIGHNVIVAAGAVVTRDIPDGVMVGGVPARIIKKVEDVII
jgi:acetyltransferase-like isoleucine patch superfamily enzyme